MCFSTKMALSQLRKLYSKMVMRGAWALEKESLGLTGLWAATIASVVYLKREKEMGSTS